MKSLFAIFSVFCLLTAAAPHCCCEEMSAAKATAAHACCADQEQAPCEGCPAMLSLEPSALVDVLSTPNPSGTDLLPALEQQAEIDSSLTITSVGTFAVPRSGPPPLPERRVLFSIFLI